MGGPTEDLWMQPETLLFVSKMFWGAERLWRNCGCNAYHLFGVMDKPCVSKDVWEKCQRRTRSASWRSSKTWGHVNGLFVPQNTSKYYQKTLLVTSGGPLWTLHTWVQNLWPVKSVAFTLKDKENPLCSFFHLVFNVFFIAEKIRTFYATGNVIDLKTWLKDCGKWPQSHINTGTHQW